MNNDLTELSDINEKDELADQLKDYRSHKDLKQHTSTDSNQKNNNRHVAPIGMLIVLFTIYLGILTIQESNGYQLQTAIIVPNDNKLKLNVIDQKTTDIELKRKLMTLQKLLEPKNICFDLEIFTKEYKPSENIDDNIQKAADLEENKQRGQVQKDAPFGKNNENELNKSYKATVARRKNYRNGHKHGNGNNKSESIKSSKEKNIKKKKVDTKKSSAEPIIYLFALVFIYLLIKAASDINQHYKSKNKADKRLRRCSLQSYAHAHKQDRRASKELQKQQNRLREFRSISVDRYNKFLTQEQIEEKSQILMELRKQTSFDESQQQQQQFQLNLASKATSTAQRRCSVPLPLNYNRQKITIIPIEPVVISRRTSVASGLGSTIGVSINSVGIGIDLCEVETKRRVRMINRH